MRMLLACGAALLLFALPLSAAEDVKRLSDFERTLDRVIEARYEVTTGLLPAEHARVLYGAYTTLSLLGADDEAGHTRTLRQVDSKLWLETNYEGHTFYGRLRLRYQDFNAGDDFFGTSSGLVAPVGDRYWYQFDWRTDRRSEEGTDPAWNWWVRLGRQDVHWVSGLALSQTLYAGRVGVETAKLRFEGLLGQTPGHGFIDFDGSRPGFSTDTDRLFWGALIEYRGRAHRPYVYFLAQNDGNDDIFGVVFEYESRYVAIGSTGQITGQLLYRTEFIYEFGDSASDGFILPQTVEDIQAWAARFELIFSPHRFRASSKLRFELEVLVASGDGDRGHSANTGGGNLSGTDDEGFNAFGYARTGLALAPDLSNLVSIRLTASAFPLRRRAAFERLRTAVDLFLMSKVDDNAPMSVTTDAGQGFLGTEVDFALEWQVHSDVAVDLRYGIFVPGDAYFESKPRHLAYVGER